MGDRFKMDQQRQNNLSRGQQAYNLAKRDSDTGMIAGIIVLFSISILIFFIINLILGFFADEDELLRRLVNVGIYIVIMMVVFGLGVLITRIQRQINLANSLNLRYSQYAHLKDWINSVAIDLGLPHIEVFITQDPYINAYAFGFYRPFNIVLHSGTIRYLSEDQLKAVIIHEMGHIKFRHTIIGIFLLPLMSITGLIPVLGGFVQWIADFYWRRAELACDRLALCYTRDKQLVQQALSVVHVGPDGAKYINKQTQAWQQYESSGFMNLMAESLVSHPFWVHRLKHLDEWAVKVGIEQSASQSQSPQPGKPKQS
jgi:Zn-dependent protease with chaperone function